MSDLTYLKRIFQAFYKEKSTEIPTVSLFDHREFGFIPWDKKVFMKRHRGFESQDKLIQFLINDGPRHVYSSGSIYEEPANQSMENKKYQGCDLIIDIDVDHFPTPCKDDHDLWYCKECGNSGKGLQEKCPKCKKTKIKKLSWICQDCLEIAKNEILKLINNFLIPDFGIKEDQMHVVFSGHRGYHLKIENKDIRTLSSDERREIVDYVTGKNISFEILGLRELGGSIYGLSMENIGWSHKIMKKTEEILRQPDGKIKNFLLNKKRFNFNENVVNSFLNYKDDYLEIITKGQKNIWAVEGFKLTRWKEFLKGIIKEISVEIDEPVTVDIHRLIRYPGSLHGGTGFKAQEVNLKELENFNPLNETKKILDPIALYSNNTHKIKITETNVPKISIKGESYGPYKLGEIDDLPHHIAIFLICKGVAKTI